MVLYGAAAILLRREAKSKNVKTVPLGGTYNVVLYYRELKSRNEKLTKRFWFFLISSINLIIFMITFLGIAIAIAFGKLPPL